MPVKDRKIELKGFDELVRKLPPPAPYMMSGMCSDCGIEAIICGDGDMKVCPKCAALLWHRDYGAEVLQRRAARLEELKRMEAERRAAKAAALEARKLALAAKVDKVEKIKERDRHKKRVLHHEPAGVADAGKPAEQAGSGVCGEGGQEVLRPDDKPADGG